MTPEIFSAAARFWLVQPCHSATVVRKGLELLRHPAECTNPDCEGAPLHCSSACSCCPCRLHCGQQCSTQSQQASAGTFGGEPALLWPPGAPAEATACRDSSWESRLLRI